MPGEGGVEGGAGTKNAVRVLQRAGARLRRSDEGWQVGTQVTVIC